MHKWWRISLGAVLTSLMVLLNTGLLWGQERYEGMPTEKPAEIKEAPPQKPVTPPGYFPGIPSSTPYGTLDLGPSSGYLAPYGNPAAYDNLGRGWRSHRIGKTVLTPYLEIDGLYDSNINSTPNNKLSDFITVITPGLRAELPIAGRHLLSLGYLGTGFIYSQFGSNTHYDQNMNVDMALKSKGGLTLRFGNTFRLATEVQNSEFSVNRRYFRETPYLNVGYAFADRWKVEGSYQYDMLHFTNNAFEVNDYNAQNLGVSLYYRFLPKTAALVQYIFTYVNYPSANFDNVFGHSPLVGLTWDPTAKLSGTVKFGYTVNEYQTTVPGRNNAPGNFTMSLNLLYRYSRATNLTLTAQRSFQQDLDFQNAAYESTGVWVALNHDWNFFRLTSYVSTFYINNNYLNPAFNVAEQFQRRLDNIVGVGVGLSRPLTKWLRSRLDYNYSNRSSNFSGYGYNDHRVMFGLQTAL
jgi:hypothetical protein